MVGSGENKGSEEMVGKICRLCGTPGDMGEDSLRGLLLVCHLTQVLCTLLRIDSRR